MRTAFLTLSIAALLGAPSFAAAQTSPPQPKAPSFGPGAGSIFTGDRLSREPHGGLQALANWDAGTRQSATGAACAQDSLELSKGAVILSCTKTPVDGPKTGWTKIEITGKKGAAWLFRYVHWPSVGTDSLTGTGVWTPDGENSSLTYTHGTPVTGTSSPEPSGPALTEPVPSGPALTEPVPSGPALTEPEPKRPAKTRTEPPAGGGE